MALINCPECGQEISEDAIICPHCGRTNKSEDSLVYETATQLTEDSTRKNTVAMVMGFILEVMALVVFFSFKGKYIDWGVTFGGDSYTYTYQTLVYIATALRFGISGILIGIGAILQCSKTATYSGNSTTRKTK